VTYDIDLCYRRTPENLARLARALNRLNPTLRNAPPDLPFVIDARSLSLGENFTFSTTLAILTCSATWPPSAALTNSPSTLSAIGSVISLDNLIRIKQHINRAKDRESLFQLLAIKRLRDEEGLR
jgi:hypothetical protein